MFENSSEVFVNGQLRWTKHMDEQQRELSWRLAQVTNDANTEHICMAEATHHPRPHLGHNPEVFWGQQRDYRLWRNDPLFIDWPAATGRSALLTKVTKPNVSNGISDTSTTEQQKQINNVVHFEMVNVGSQLTFASRQVNRAKGGNAW